MKKFVCVLIITLCLLGSNAYAYGWNKTAQKVEFYQSALEARRDMNKHIENGWLIHTVEMNTISIRNENVLVVYEKECVLVDYEPEQR